ncbi:hypothetical protein ICY20_23905 [Pseudomonas sp. P115]|uniref:hypothetical protein n=1 Tax=Pseudomonas pisciculturae TaxID=2730413 RepID=UPI0018923C62|nr:hypothetical protein [Pseudomonas pisciculturae]MBF6030798.1 hypothetical protein [Pseudomonas pisciculturae]
MSNEPAHISESFDSETLSAMRQSARTYQKLDLTYLAAAGTLITALKISNDTLIELGGGFFFGAIAFILLLANDTYTEQLIFSDWIESKKTEANRESTKTIERTLKRQPLFHLLFLSCVLMYFFGMAKGITDFRGDMHARSAIQDYTSLFFDKKSRPPKSMGELVGQYPRAADAHAKIDHEPLSFSVDEESSYKIIFAGRDRKFGTADDVAATSDISLARIMKATKNTKSDD